MELILVVNSGSSSHKCSVFEPSVNKPIWHAHMQWKDQFHDATLSVETEGIEKNIEIKSSRDGLEAILKTLPNDFIAKNPIIAIGHRVVHGGEAFQEVTLITKEVKEQIKSLIYLAPLHNPANLEGIETTEALFPGIPQFAVFDTAFHSTLSEAAATYPIPYKWRKEAIRRYGFHGISHSYCSKKAASFVGQKGKMIVCHLGAGASLCAVDKGISIDTTMGMTPLEGLMMASRSGSVDPGILLHFLHNENLSVDQVDQMLNKESGLLGISGISEDMRDIQEGSEQGNQRATLAFNMFIHRLRTHIGMMLGALGGLDTLVFTAGIGENSPYVREKTCQHFNFIGLKIDPKKNEIHAAEDREISTSDSTVRVLVIPTQEEWEIAAQIHNQLSYRS